MGSGRKFQSTNLTRPRKKGGAKRRRQLEQRRRLVRLGVDAAVAEKMTARAILTMLQRPAKIAKGE